jgi:hypothetical protein
VVSILLSRFILNLRDEFLSTRLEDKVKHGSFHINDIATVITSNHAVDDVVELGDIELITTNGSKHRTHWIH